MMREVHDFPAMRQLIAESHSRKPRLWPKVSNAMNCLGFRARLMFIARVRV
jgi:hypothetical protein